MTAVFVSLHQRHLHCSQVTWSGNMVVRPAVSSHWQPLFVPSVPLNIVTTPRRSCSGTLPTAKATSSWTAILQCAPLIRTFRFLLLRNLWFLPHPLRAQAPPHRLLNLKPPRTSVPC